MNSLGRGKILHVGEKILPSQKKSCMSVNQIWRREKILVRTKKYCYFCLLLLAKGRPFFPSNSLKEYTTYTNTSISML